jgi:hypothetical protein
MRGVLVPLPTRLHSMCLIKERDNLNFIYSDILVKNMSAQHVPQTGAVTSKHPADQTISSTIFQSP